MIGNKPGNIFGGMADAQVIEQERPFSVPTTTESGMDPSVARVFTGLSNETQTNDFARALSGTSDVMETPLYETTDLAQAMKQETAEAPTNIATAPENPVFDLAERAHTKDMEDLALLQAELAELTATLTSQVLEAKAQDQNALQEEAKYLLAQESNTGGIYYVNFVHQLVQSAERFLKSLKQLITNSAGKGASWIEGTKQHNRMRDEHKLQSQAAG